MKKEIVVIPLAGHGRRFRSAGYPKPKQMLEPDSKSNLEHSLEAINPEKFKLIFILRYDQIQDEEFDKFIEQTCSKYEYEIVVISFETRGSVETVMQCRHLIEPDAKLTIFTMDVSFHPSYNSEVFGDADGGVLTFKSNSANYSYARIENGYVKETAEKIVLSDSAIVGIYYFRKAELFFTYGEKMLKAQSISAGEYYIAPLYNGMIHDKLRIAAQSVDRFYVFGIPSEYEFYRNHILRNSSIQRVGICSDHSGFKLKEELHAILEFFKIKVIDYGTHSTANTDYNEWVSKAADGYLNNEVDLIIASCLSGQGVAVAASTYPFLIPSIIYDSEAAQLAMLHTCSNFLAFPSKVWNTNFDLKSALHVVLNTKFEGGRHQLRLMKMLENKL